MAITRQKSLKLLSGLADDLECDKHTRRKCLKSRVVLEWPSTEQTGVISFESVACNSEILKVVIRKWCSQMDKPKTLPVNELKTKADGCGFVVVYFWLLTWSLCV